MAIKWTEELSVGVELIDQEHQLMFEKAGLLFDAGKKGQAKEEIASLLLFLDEYTKKHFADEEKFMASVSYPELDKQKTMHAGFIGELGKLKKDYIDSGSNISVIMNANQMVIDWLVKHIANEDKKIGDYIRTMK
jgi:hemerythrin